jgi:signal transduction histidine kinase
MLFSLRQKSEVSFKRQLIVIVSVGIFVLAITASISTAWVTSNNLRSLLIKDGLQLAESIAEQSVLALLYDSGENAKDAVRVALAFPSVTHVQIISRDYKPIYLDGIDAPDIEDIKWPTDATELGQEDEKHWLFVAPVHTQGQIQTEEDPMLLQTEADQELLGYVLVLKNKDELYENRALTITNNLGIALLIAIPLLLILWARFGFLTKPLDKLSNVMSSAEKGGEVAYADTSGPKEVVQIALAFNRMMAALVAKDQQLRDHNVHLEAEVALRTQELVYARDVAIEANKNKSEFLANVTHELRTPLQAIMGYTDLIRESVDEEGMEDLHADLDCIISNSNNLLALINEVLDLSKVESGRMDINLGPENLETLVIKVEGTIKHLMKENNNQLIIEVEQTHSNLEVDGTKIRQIMLNLLSNAAKFTENGQVNLLVKQASNEISINVRDTGVGISKEHQEMIFDHFRQIDGTRTRKFQGTGLGLAITRKFCQLMGGDIKVESTPNEGSSFTVSIPLPIIKVVEE